MLSFSPFHSHFPHLIARLAAPWMLRNFSQHLSEITDFESILGCPSLSRLTLDWMLSISILPEMHGNFFFRNPMATGTVPSDLYVICKPHTYFENG